MTATPSTTTSSRSAAAQTVLQLAAVLLLLFVFLLGVNGLGHGFKSLGEGLLEQVFRVTANPFTGLMVGILTTSLVQSSSVTTSLVVGLVAAPESPLPIENAVPMIMGANIGTTVTSTIVALGHMGRREEFRRAFAVATCHDFFNYFTVLILLPLELATGFLRRGAVTIAGLVTGMDGVEYESPIRDLLEAGWAPVQAGVAAVGLREQAAAFALIGIAGLLILIALFLLVRVMRTSMKSRVERMVFAAFEDRALVAMIIGVVATVMVQSSSITTALLVPLGGAGVLTLAQAFPITIGANIGTTVTALLAALAASGPNAGAGITIALVHLLFNMTGALLIYPVPALRRVPLGAARWLADTAVRSRRWALIYVVTLFYIVPALFAALGRLFRQ